MYSDTVEDVFYGQATDDGDYDDVETYGPGGGDTVDTTPAVMMLAWGIVVVSLAALWAMGAAVFKGSNQS